MTRYLQQKEQTNSLQRNHSLQRQKNDPKYFVQLGGKGLSGVPCSTPCKIMVGATASNTSREQKSIICRAHAQMFSEFITLTLAGRLIRALETAGPNLFFIKSFGSGTGACFAMSEGWGERSAENPPVPAQGSSTSAGAARAAISERLVVNLMARNELSSPAPAFIKPPSLRNVSTRPTHGQPPVCRMTVRPQDAFSCSGQDRMELFTLYDSELFTWCSAQRSEQLS